MITNQYERVKTVSLLLSIALSSAWGCDDTSAGASSGLGGVLSEPGRAGVEAERPLEGLGGAALAGEAAGEEGLAGSWASGGGTAGLCGLEQPCEAGLNCFQGRCVEESLCEGGSCAEGFICVGGLCFEDPNASPREEGALRFEPSRMRFVFQGAGASAQQLTQLVNLGERALTLSALRFEGSGTFSLLNPPQLPARLSPNSPLSLELQHLANDELPDSAQLIAETEEGPQSLLTLIAETKGAQPAAPCLELSPPQIFFGSVGRGQSVTRDVSLRSCGESLVTVRALNRGRSLFGELPQTFSFVPPALPLQLAAGDSVSFPVTYTPRRAGLEAGFIEVLSDDASDPSQRVDLSAVAEPPPLDEVALHVKLTWDSDYTDVDLHLLGPGGQLWTCEGDCYFSNGNPNWGDQATDLDDPFLDLDDVDGYGPENINLEAPGMGTYQVLVHYWDAHEGSPPNANIELYSFGTLMGSFGPEPLNAVNDVWVVAEIDFPGFVIRPIDATSQQPRGSLCGGF